MALPFPDFRFPRPVVDLLIAVAGFLALSFFAGAIDLSEAWHDFPTDRESAA